MNAPLKRMTITREEPKRAVRFPLFAAMAQEHFGSAREVENSWKDVITREMVQAFQNTEAGRGLSVHDAVLAISREHGEFQRISTAHCHIAVVFAQMALEGYIYDYAVRRLSEAYFRKHIGKLGLKKRWIVVPELVTGKKVITSDKAIVLLGKLIKTRNDLVHPKSRLVSSNEELIRVGHEYNPFLEAVKAVWTLEEMAQWIVRQDPSEERHAKLLTTPVDGSKFIAHIPKLGKDALVEGEYPYVTTDPGAGPSTG